VKYNNKQISLSDDALFALVNFFKMIAPIDFQIDFTTFNHSYLQPDEISSFIN